MSIGMSHKLPLYSSAIARLRSNLSFSYSLIASLCFVHCNLVTDSILRNERWLPLPLSKIQARRLQLFFHSFGKQIDFATKVFRAVDQRRLTRFYSELFSSLKLLSGCTMRVFDRILNKEKKSLIRLCLYLSCLYLYLFWSNLFSYWTLLSTFNFQFSVIKGKYFNN